MPQKKLAYDSLRWKPDRAILDEVREFDKIKATDAVVGQKRAIEALDIGLKLYHRGYNIYVAGVAGTGRISTIRRALEQIRPERERPPDRCYVYNFTDASQPVLLNFPAGKGRAFRDDMKELVRVLRLEVPKAIEASHIQRERELIVERYQREEKRLFEEFAERLKKDGYALVQVQEGGYVSPTVFPIVGNEAVSLDYLDQLVTDGKMEAAERDSKVRRHKELTADLKRVLTKARGLGKEMHQALDRLLQRSASAVLDGLMDDMRARYEDEKVRKYLMRVKSHVLKNIDAFSGKKEQREPSEGIIVLGSKAPEDPFWVYEVNLLYDQSAVAQEEGLPIVEEQNPSYSNIFGAVEYVVGSGNFWSTDFRHIKAGNLIKADGGYLIVNAMDILRRPHVWDQLKRVLRTEKLVIQQPETYFQMAPMAIKPEPIELHVKVIMIGPNWLYSLLYNYEEDFPKTFKVLADFDTTMPLTAESAGQFASVLKAVGDRGKLRSLEHEGIIAMMEHGVEEAGQQDRISTRFAYITDILREADYWAGVAESKTIGRKHVEKAIDAKRERHRMTEERVQRMIDEGVILIDSKGKRVGQVNALSVYSMGHISFGKPSRVTATTSLGKAGIINIEREAKLSGPIHDKGMMILSGYLRQKYAQKEPLNLTASICFEQSYGGIDGDSASSTEIYAILSSLSGLPISQEFAVTGSVNQLGDIQPIGGANEKIEGFYAVCKAQGITGKQGVIIPAQNVRHLMLNREVTRAVKEGKFHIYPISKIDEGLELLMGKPAGVMGKSGGYPPNSIHGLAMKRLKTMNKAMKESGGEDGKKRKKKAKGKKKASRKKGAVKR